MLNIILILALILLIPASITFYFIRKSYLFDKAMKSSRKGVICPKCGKLVPLKWFVCDRCQKIIELIPRENAIFYHHCECGAQLPTSNDNGRQKLTAVCPTLNCGNILGKEAGENEEFVIPVIGSRSAGKTAFLSAWIVASTQRLPVENELDVSFPYLKDQNYAQSCVLNWYRGLSPNQTKELIPSGFGIDICKKNQKHGIRVYTYDPAGEVFDEEKYLTHFRYYDLMDGAVFLIDPFAIHKVKQKYAKQLNNKTDWEFQIADRDINDCCDRFINSLHDFHNLKNTEYHYAYCAVVLTKIDSFDLDSLLGESAIRQTMQEKSLNYLDAMNELCCHFLHENGIGDLLSKLEENFKEVRCFSISSFGHMPDTGQSYIPKRVDLPFKWLLTNAIRDRRKQRSFVGKYFPFLNSMFDDYYLFFER